MNEAEAIEERTLTHEAIHNTRRFFMNSLSLDNLIMMSLHGVKPKAIENAVTEVLRYLEDTKPEEAES